MKNQSDGIEPIFQKHYEKRLRMKSKYLVRPNDMHIFEVDESNGYYRSYTTRNVVYHDGGRPNASDHMTYENLTNNYNFFPIDELNLSIYEYFHSVYMDFIIWQNRSDGHGGTKGGTFEEFLRYFEINTNNK